ncbi:CARBOHYDRATE-BINDING X8 DOMAIN SUPERFAMILY PROTEIN [Salix purpurea]|uniref:CARBOHYDRATE-BINDING X8 DOMAIN SUPERFAMILY PROTEIN n=1 Tax=Salix purpurea TaxID=77065 RepID=A0A9Q0WY12_SALPP|nr:CARBOHYDRATE-BINDING X8 DOMAIN SUPERFAMILY PROTEIN [Salix purpurea]
MHVAIAHGICPRVKEGALYFEPVCVLGKDKEARKAAADYSILSTLQGGCSYSSCLFSLLALQELLWVSPTMPEEITAASSLGRIVTFLELNKVSASHIRVFAADHRVLSTLSNFNVSADLYLDDSLVENLTQSKPSAISWLKAQIVTFLPHVNIRSIIVSVAFSLTFLEKLNRTQEKDFRRILGFIKRTTSFVIIETSIDMDVELGMKDLFIQSMIQKVAVATSLFSPNDAPIVMIIKSLVIPSAKEVAEFGDRVSKSLGNTKDQRSVFPTNPGSTPAVVTLLPDTPTPTIITVPATIPADPVAVTPTNPVSTPLPFPNTTPVNVTPTNPFSPAGNTPITAPVTNPAAPPATTNAPAIPGQSWCVARSGVMETALQPALDYACGMGGADCSQIQQGGNCYSPNTLQNHASYAFNSYYQKNPVASSCDFGGTATIVNVNPSTGSCVYPSSSSPYSVIASAHNFTCKSSDNITCKSSDNFTCKSSDDSPPNPVTTSPANPVTTSPANPVTTSPANPATSPPGTGCARHSTITFELINQPCLRFRFQYSSCFQPSSIQVNYFEAIYWSCHLCFKVLYRRTIFDSKETGGRFHKNELQHQDPETFSGQPEGAQNVKTFTAEVKNSGGLGSRSVQIRLQGGGSIISPVPTISTMSQLATTTITLVMPGKMIAELPQINNIEDFIFFFE